MQIRWLSAALLGLSLVVCSGQVDAKERYHEVYKGQRLGSIAKRYRVSVDALCAANGLERRSTIQPGQKLLIPAAGESVEDARKRGEAAGQTQAAAKSKRADSADKSAQKAKAGDDKRSDKEAAKPSNTKPRGSAKASKQSSHKWVVHTIVKGQRLGSIAKRYRVSIDALSHANDITPSSVIKPGQLLVIPSRDDESGEAARKAFDSGRIPGLQSEDSSAEPSSSAKASKTEKWTDYRRPPRRRGYVTLIGAGGSWKGYVTAAKGRLNPAARSAIAGVLDADDLDGGIHPRLIQLLAEVSDTFGGRPIRVVSGHRTASYARASRHALGHAIDFSIPGVPNAALRDFLLRYTEVGVGYYPNSSFVHFDVRGSKTYWIDQSGPGEPPRYSYIGKGPVAKKSTKK